jgi:UDP-N-acetylglucosamine--N-acetylmuramyl-(pentapeptide) pyrophosphoryl-undecaprenol N-acetylglucosamine transferase
MIKKEKILIATGGTGGHVFPAYSLANHFIKNNYNVKLTTDKRGYNYLKNYENLNLIKIPSSPLNKNNIFKLLLSILIILFSVFRSLVFLLFNKPSIVFGMGGYSSFPICIAAKFLRIKFVIYENNLIIGKANKYLLPFANKIFVSYKDLEGVPYKYNNKIIEIGNIVREEIINLKNENDQNNKFNDIKILVLGGSQAAKVFADKLPKIFKKLKNSEIPIKVYQQCHNEQNDQLSEFYRKNNINCEIFNFTNKIIDYYTKANLVITRSGASVLGELINIKIPFISIPLPTSADNHQLKNAIYYKKKGFGYLMDEKDINDQLYPFIKSIFKDKTLIKNILAKQSQYSDKNIFQNLNNQIEKIIHEKN